MLNLPPPKSPRLCKEIFKATDIPQTVSGKIRENSRKKYPTSSKREGEGSKRILFGLSFGTLVRCIFCRLILNQTGMLWARHPNTVCAIT